MSDVNHRRGLPAFVTDGRVLQYGAMGLAAAFLVLYLAFGCDNIYRDVANCYADMTRTFAGGDWLGAFHPALPILNVGLAGGLTWIGIEPVPALVIVSGVFYIATIPALYAMLKYFLPPAGAGWGAVLFACTPRVIQMAGSGMLDTAKIFFLILAVLCWLRMLHGPRRKTYAVLLGVALGGLSLARSEGIFNAVFLMGAAGVYLLADLKNKKQRRFAVAVQCLLVAVPWGLLLLPRFWINRMICGEWIFDRRLSFGMDGLLSKPDAGGATAGMAVVDVGKFLETFANGSYVLYLIAAAVGLALLCAGGKYAKLLWRDGRPEWAVWRPEYYLLLTVVLGNAAVHFFSINAWRYFMLNGPVLMVFSVIGFWWLIRTLPHRLKPWLPLLAGTAVLSLQIAKGLEDLESEPDDDYHTGMWLRENIAPLTGRPNREVVTLFSSSSPVWYWTDTARAWPIEAGLPDLAAFTEFDLIIWGGREEGIETLRGRDDLELVPMPFDNSTVVFRKAAQP